MSRAYERSWFILTYSVLEKQNNLIIYAKNFLYRIGPQITIALFLNILIGWKFSRTNYNDIKFIFRIGS